jgi:hypothetical protein
MSWRDQILTEFTPQIARLTLVPDPDNLLSEEGVLQAILQRGFEIITFENAIAFRYFYESQYRPRQERGEAKDLVVLVKAEEQALRNLPYDLLYKGRQLAFSLGNIFPNLSYTVVNALDRSDFDALYQAQTQHNLKNTLGDNATKDFVLRYVFDIDPQLIKQPSDLLLILLRRHYRSQRLPAILDEHFIQKLKERKLFPTWFSDAMVSDRQAFFTFLQEQWSDFVRRQLTPLRQTAESQGTYAVQTKIPFDNRDIRVYIDNLFSEGYLQPVSVDDFPLTSVKEQSKSWLAVGLRIDPVVQRQQRLQKLIESVESSKPRNDAKYQEWLKFAQTWAELLVLWHQETTSNPLSIMFLTLQEKVDNAFLTWVSSRYGSLYNQSTTSPVMVHQIPRFLTRWYESKNTKKIALIVIDGLAFDQWLILRNVLLTKCPQFKFHEEAAFAWIPTITSVSRQAIFAGKPPIYFANSLETTAKEELFWTQFWADQGIIKPQVAYTKGLGEPGSLLEVEKVVSHPKLKVVGLVVDKVDKIMHGMQLGTAGMHNQVRQWAETGFMAELLNLLVSKGFQVFLTSDHGNLTDLEIMLVTAIAKRLLDSIALSASRTQPIAYPVISIELNL